MLTRALDAGVPAAWATADEFYGVDSILRRDLQARSVGYVMAVAKSHRITLPIGVLRADQATARLHRRCWNRLSAGKGAKGERAYDSALLRITPPAVEAAGHHWLLVRRRISDGELAQYRCWSPKRVTLAALVRVAGIRWSIEECFQASRGEVGLDEHQVRKWNSWYRSTTLAMLAHALLSVIAAHERRRHATTDDGLIPLTVNEIRHLFAKTLTNTVRTISYWLRWATWRRRHQQRALTSHYRRRGADADCHPST